MDYTFEGMDVCPGCHARLINVRHGERLCAPCKEGEPSRPSLHKVVRVDPDGSRRTLPGPAGYATMETIQAMNEAARDTGYRYEAGEG